MSEMTEERGRDQRSLYLGGGGTVTSYCVNMLCIHVPCVHVQVEPTSNENKIDVKRGDVQAPTRMIAVDKTAAIGIG
jgi:hypothetical protein